MLARLVGSVALAAALVARAGGAPLPAHPRLVLTSDRVAAINAFTATNDDARFFLAGTAAEAEWVLSQKPFPPQHGTTGTPNDRGILQRLYAVGVMHRLTANATWSARAVPEVLNAVAADQWDEGGSATLNTGEMLHAVGMAFDWNYGAFTDAQREAVIAGSVKLGLANIRAALGASPPSWAGAFVNTSSNWNTVILGGTIVACLAFGDEPSTPAWVMDELLPRALTGIQSSLVGWGADGGWMEGNNYAGEARRPPPTPPLHPRAAAAVARSHRVCARARSYRTSLPPTHCASQGTRPGTSPPQRSRCSPPRAATRSTRSSPAFATRLASSCTRRRPTGH